MHTILGANGVIGVELSKRLPQHTESKIRQVSRNPKKVNANDTTFAANLLRYDETEKAVAGSEVVYLVAGLPYSTKVWQKDWPILMRNVIDACQKHNSKLVFFDNVYAYGRVSGKMTEQTPFNPCSKKGEVRAKVATMMLDEMQKKNIHGMIVRAADFYGPGALLSLTHSTITEKLKHKKGPQWVGDPRKVHTFTYTPDAGKTLALLGTTPSAFQQTWHALTSKEAMTGEWYSRLAHEALSLPEKKIQALPKWGVRVLGLFVPVLGEFVEMMYQFEDDYVFDSSKFENTYQIKATAYVDGIVETLK